MPGKLVVFEGIDGAGKSSGVARVAGALQQRGKSAATFAFPDRSTATGKLLQTVLKSEAKLPPESVHLLFTANRWECAEALRAALDAHDFVLLDRYSLSGVAYSVGCYGLDLDWCIGLEQRLPQPDLTVYLDISVQTSMQRLEGRAADVFENEAMLTRVHEAYAQLAARVAPEKWFTVDGAQSPAACTDAIVTKLLSLLAQ